MRKNKSEASKYTLSPLEESILAGIREGKPFLGQDGTLTPLIKRVLETALGAELETHMNSSKEEDSPNRRNGVTSKRVRSGMGSFELETPRDRLGEFEPQIVRKHQTVLTDEPDGKILSLFGQGMSDSDIRPHLKDIYGVELSPGMISKITDQLL